MGNIVTNVYAKSNYDRLRIDKARGFRTFDNMKEQQKQEVKNNVRSDWKPLMSPKSSPVFH